MKTRTYVITYVNKDDPTSPRFSLRYRAYSEESAVERFWDSDDQDWTIISVKVAR